MPHPNRQKWYDNAPFCPICGEHRVYVAEARIGFFGLNVQYLDRCNVCLPPAVAREAIAVRRRLTELEEEGETR